MNLLNVHFLFASLIWGSIGVGYCIYGKRQQSIVPFIGGVLMIIASYFISSALLMSLDCLGLMVGVYVLVKQGY
jgi:hypothetical protein